MDRVMGDRRPYRTHVERGAVRVDGRRRGLRDDGEAVGVMRSSA
jgi:hypothetical protein